MPQCLCSCSMACRAPTFFRSLTGSFRAFMTRAAAEGMTDTFAILFCTLSLHVTRRPFHSFAVSFAISSPICTGRQTVHHSAVTEAAACRCTWHVLGDQPGTICDGKQNIADR